MGVATFLQGKPQTDSGWGGPAGLVSGAVGIGSGIGGTLKDGLVAPNSYDANSNLEDSKKKAAALYGSGMQQSALIAAQGGAPSGLIQADKIAAPAPIVAQTVATPGAVAARDVATSGLVVGTEADALRAKAIGQAEAAAAAPGSAAAQMRLAGTQIAQQQLGQAAMARGADRAGARRAAMLGTGQQGLGAAQATAALAASENAQKQAALTGALQGVRAGDVSIADAATRPAQLNQAADIQLGALNTGNALKATTANQDAGLKAAVETGQLGFLTGQSNQKAQLESQEATIKNQQDAWARAQEARQGWEKLSLEAVGAQNQAQGVAATYGAKQNETMQEAAGGLISGAAKAGAMLGLSDERAKTDISGIGNDGLDSLMGSTHGTSTYGDMANEFGALQTSPSVGDAVLGGMDTLGKRLSHDESPERINQPTTGKSFLDWQMAPIASKQSKGGGLGIDSLASLAGGSGLLSGTSDERAKRDVERMGDDEVADWSESVPTAVWRYKKGIPGTDDGEEYHTGTLAGALQRTGPLGRLMVHKRPDGLKEVEYGPLGLMVGKGALSRANEALDWAKAAYSMAAGKGLVHG